MIKDKLKKNILRLVMLKRLEVYSILAVMGILFLCNIIFPLPEMKQFSKVIYAEDGSMLSAYLTNDDKWRMKTSSDEISPQLSSAIIAKEDNWFYWHPGVNPFALIRAAFQNIVTGERVSGASTITMQLARMMQSAKRTYTNKLIEMFRAVQLELYYSKDEILEMYLSLLPYGGNVEGVKSASYIYFNRPPAKLSLSQSILLTIIPNNPNLLRLDRGSDQILKERNKWIQIFAERNLFKNDELKDAIEEPVPAERYIIKTTAPHFCRVVMNKSEDSDIRTTLNLSIQKTAEQLLSKYLERVKERGISNGAVLIINNRTNSVSGYCGSGDFNDKETDGQVNGITSIRSPGSALKPALYAMAFDHGLLTPAMKLNDTPTDFNGFEPVNFDQSFRGEVTADYALVNSLNIPAVELLQKCGFSDFVSFAGKAGFKDIDEKKSSLGLSLILGGCSVRLEQLTKFYTSFAHNGILNKLNYLKQDADAEDKGVKLISPEAAFMIASILSNNQRPDFPNDLLYSTNLPKIGWKTGTSFGKRDAWAIGFNPDYTIGVWLGNFDGRGSAELTGAGSAVPLLFELFNSIDYKPSKLWFDKPDDLLEREVCSETGLLPGVNCIGRINDYYIKNVSPNIRCDLYKSFYVNKDETVQYCTECVPDTGYIKSSYPVYRSELTVWLLKNKVQFRRPPPHYAICQTKRSGDGPKILSPVEDYEYYVESGSTQQMMLQAASDPSVKQHYWYIDDQFYKKTGPGEKIFFKPDGGNMKIVCLDDFGREGAVNVKIKYY